MTDSDGAGLVIRNRIKGCISSQYLKHAYIPDVPGKEKRKRVPGKEGMVGVEGMKRDVILESLRRAGATIDGEAAQQHYGITKQDMMDLGLSGGENSAALRSRLQKKLGFPDKMSANALLQSLNLLYTLDELTSILEEIYD